MKEIKAFIRPNKVNIIVNKLKEKGYENITISLAEGTGRFQDKTAFVSQNFSITDSEIAKLEIVSEDKAVIEICDIICELGCTLNPGDGLIYVSDIEKAIRVKTGLENGQK